MSLGFARKRISQTADYRFMCRQDGQMDKNSLFSPVFYPAVGQTEGAPGPISDTQQQPIANAKII